MAGLLGIDLDAPSGQFGISGWDRIGLLSQALSGFGAGLQRRRAPGVSLVPGGADPGTSGWGEAAEGGMNAYRAGVNDLQRRGLLGAQMQSATLARKRAELEIEKAQREQLAEQELGDAASGYLQRNPMQSTMVSPRGIPTLPDAPDATRANIPGTGGAANPAGLLKDPNYLAVMARRYPTQFATMATKKPNIGSVAPGATVFDYDAGQPLFTAPDESHLPQGYQPGPDGKLTFTPGGPADPSVIGTQARARESENYREREVPLPNGQIRKEFSRDRGATWQALGDVYDRRNTGQTPTQTARNGDIQAARRQLEGMSREDIVKSAQPLTPSGRPNPDYNPFVARAARIASRKLVGEDDPDHGQFWGRMIPNEAADDAGGGTQPAPDRGGQSILGPRGSYDLTKAANAEAAEPVPMRGGAIDRARLKRDVVYSDGKGGSWRWTGMGFEAAD